MKAEVWSEIQNLIETHFPIESLRLLMKKSVEDKREEQSIWGELTLGAHDLLGGNHPAIHRVAALTELILLALDIMDDLQDQDNTAKPWMRIPQEQALNIYTGFVTASISELGALRLRYPGSPLPDPAQVGRFITEAINGQHLDITCAAQSEEDYVDMVQRKSGALVQLALYLGYTCTLGGSNEETVSQLNLLGLYTGLMAQLDNDLSDLLRFDYKNDIVQKKQTIPVMFLLDEEEEGSPWIRQYYQGEIDQEQFLKHKPECVEYIYGSGCIEYTRTIQNLYLHHADELLAEIPALASNKEAFRQVALARFEL
ncbi:polyprenyl synthetase family protein [Paenibacillus sp. FJAT-26967]|uniref:polyprenyl synthetase family protein n=1 Tax=Paenibacillus sp. FJAT-26967 TaxID=1729690 RepID=UPI000839889C|nr:polyprenyl synthetase family protein [Paenibacillus sp. FJAT-26967]